MSSRLIRIIVGATLVVAQACWIEVAVEPIGVIAPQPWPRTIHLAVPS